MAFANVTNMNMYQPGMAVTPQEYQQAQIQMGYNNWANAFGSIGTAFGTVTSSGSSGGAVIGYNYYPQATQAISRARKAFMRLASEVWHEEGNKFEEPLDELRCKVASWLKVA